MRFDEAQIFEVTGEAADSAASRRWMFSIYETCPLRTHRCERSLKSDYMYILLTHLIE